jgi:hypothetical protein
MVRCPWVAAGEYSSALLARLARGPDDPSRVSGGADDRTRYPPPHRPVWHACNQPKQHLIDLQRAMQHATCDATCDAA